MREILESTLEADSAEKVELELVCANQKFFGKAKALDMITKYQQLKDDFPELVVIKEPEATHGGYIYKEVSMFVPANQVPKYKELLAQRGIEVDVVHERTA